MGKGKLIVIKQEVKDALDSLKLHPRETYDDTVERLIKHYLDFRMTDPKRTRVDTPMSAALEETEEPEVNSENQLTSCDIEVEEGESIPVPMPFNSETQVTSTVTTNEEEKEIISESVSLPEDIPSTEEESNVLNRQ